MITLCPYSALAGRLALDFANLAVPPHVSSSALDTARTEAADQSSTHTCTTSILESTAVAAVKNTCGPTRAQHAGARRLEPKRMLHLVPAMPEDSMLPAASA